VKSRLVLSLGLSIGAVGVEPGVIRTANETGEITLVCGHDALAVGPGMGQIRPSRPDPLSRGVGVPAVLGSRCRFYQSQYVCTLAYRLIKRYGESPELRIPPLVVWRLDRLSRTLKQYEPSNLVKLLIQCNAQYVGKLSRYFNEVSCDFGPHQTIPVLTYLSPSPPFNPAGYGSNYYHLWRP
jgi:hypothetical protein